MYRMGLPVCEWEAGWKPKLWLGCPGELLVLTKTRGTDRTTRKLASADGTVVAVLDEVRPKVAAVGRSTMRTPR